jgi:hypothetical protein
MSLVKVGEAARAGSWATGSAPLRAPARATPIVATASAATAIAAAPPWRTIL